jgi:replication factor C large subunit
MMWSEKHRPIQVEKMVGNENSRLTAVRWLTGWVSGTRPLLLVGPPGAGKTTFVHALARQFDYDLVELNASDSRNKDALLARIIPVFQNTGLLGRKIMLFLDEVDGISGREDAGGLDTLADLMKEPTVPVIMAANAKSTKTRQLAKACTTLEFSPVPPRLLMLLLDHILHSEDVELGPGDRISIVNNSGGDVRSMLNSAQSRVAGYDTVSNKDNIDMNVADAINKYFASNNIEESSTFINKADASYPDPRYTVMTPEARRKDMVAALFSSIVSSQVKHQLASMLDVLSKADVIVGRASMKRQWSLLKYVARVIALGLYEKSRHKDMKYNQYSMPWPVMGPIYARSLSTRRILINLAPAVHMSRSSCGSLVFPYFMRIMIDNKIDPVEFAADNFHDQSVGESLAKEMERVKK